MLIFLEIIFYIGLIAFIVGLVWLLFNLIRKRNLRIPSIITVAGLVFSIGAIVSEVHRENAAIAQSRKESSEFESMLDDESDDNSSTDTDSSSSDDSLSSESSSTSSSDSESSSSESVDSNYPDISSQFNLKDMDMYTNADLTGKSVQLKNFQIRSKGKDKMGQYHYLLAPKSNDTALFLVVTDDKLEPNDDNEVTLDGTLNGIGSVNSNQIKSGISRWYEDKDVILFTLDKQE